MDIYKLKDMKGGWFIGDFDPAAFRTTSVEVAYHEYRKDQEWPKHHHKIATEINYMIAGRMLLGDQELAKGDVFVIPAGESVKPHYLEDCQIIVVKIPSVPGDKYEDAE